MLDDPRRLAAVCRAAAAVTTFTRQLDLADENLALADELEADRNDPVALARNAHLRGNLLATRGDLAGA